MEGGVVATTLGDTLGEFKFYVWEKFSVKDQTFNKY